MEKFISSRELLENADLLYSFVDLFSEYESMPRDYGSGELFSMTEIHILNAVYKNPGITAGELVAMQRRTKGFISQVISKFMDRRFLITIPDETNAKRKPLYVTAEGMKLCVAHDNFDEQTLAKTYRYLRRDCTEEEIESFYKVVQVYVNIMMAAKAKRARLAAENNESLKK